VRPLLLAIPFAEAERLKFDLRFVHIGDRRIGAVKRPIGGGGTCHKAKRYGPGPADPVDQADKANMIL